MQTNLYHRFDRLKFKFNTDSFSQVPLSYSLTKLDLVKIEYKNVQQYLMSGCRTSMTLSTLAPIEIEAAAASTNDAPIMTPNSEE